MKKIRLTEAQVNYIRKRLNEIDGADTPSFDATSQVKTDGVEQGIKKVVNQAKQSGINGARVTVDSEALNEDSFEFHDLSIHDQKLAEEACFASTIEELRDICREFENEEAGQETFRNMSYELSVWKQPDGGMMEQCKFIGSKGKLMEMKRKKLMENSIKTVNKKNLFK